MPFCIKFLLISCLFSTTCLQAQNSRQIDSLKRLLLPQKIDTFQVNLLNKIAFLYATSDSANTFLFANKANEKSIKLNYKKGIAKSLEAKGNLFISKTNGLKALVFLKMQALYGHPLMMKYPMQKALEIWGKPT